MADPQIKFKRSSVASKRPSLGILTTGEFAINIFDGSLFTVRDTGGVGIATTVTNLTPWTENFGGESITYSGIQTSNAGAATTDYSEVTLSGLSPSSFDQTYSRQTTGFVLDTGTVSSGNALFHADSNYYYYVATTGSFADGRALIWSEEDNNWVTIFNMGGDFTEGNVSNNDAVGSVFVATVTSGKTTADGRNVPTASGSIVYSSSGGGGITTSRVGVITFTTSGDANFAGVVTATHFHGDGSNLTNISAGSTENIVTESLVVTGLSTFNSHLNIADDVRIKVGTGTDLQIYHDGDHSYISDEGQGNLKLRSNNFRFSNADESKISITASPPGAVELYYDNIKRFETTGYGITVTDTVESPQLNVTGIATVGFATVGVATVGILSVTSQFYPPFLTSEQRDEIGIKSEGNLTGFSTGALIFNSTLEKLQLSIGSTWASLTTDIDPYSIINM